MPGSVDAARSVSVPEEEVEGQDQSRFRCRSVGGLGRPALEGGSEEAQISAGDDDLVVTGQGGCKHVGEINGFPVDVRLQGQNGSKMPAPQPAEGGLEQSTATLQALEANGRDWEVLVPCARP